LTITNRIFTTHLPLGIDLTEEAYSKPPRSFHFTISELSGALADLGVLLPLALAMISINHLNPRSVFLGLGIAYLLTALAYQLPLPIQPLKSLAATALALGLSVSQIIAGAWLMSIAFFGLALARLDRTISVVFPKAIIRGIQLGLGVLLLRAALNLIVEPGDPWLEEISIGAISIPSAWVLALSAGILLIAALRIKPGWAALGVVLLGFLIGGIWNSGTTVQQPVTSSLMILPSGEDFLSALWVLVLPQIPLSLGNAVFATTDAAQRYFGDQAENVTPRRLLSTMSISNVVAATLGGIPVCHGSGGLTAHYRLGARSGGAPLMLGVGFLTLGLLNPGSLFTLLSSIPFPILAVLLGFVGVNHARLAGDLNDTRGWATAIILAASAAIARNLAIGFAVGLAFHVFLSLFDRVRK
jgi:SulP family sulfate permease